MTRGTSTPANGAERRARLAAARLYLVCDARPGGREPEELAPFLDAVLAAGVDVVQLRDKDARDDEILTAAVVFRIVADRHGALFVLNDRAELVIAAEADGVHVGQDDMAVRDARLLLGDERLVGLSTHTPEQVEAVDGADYFCVGPVHATPTKAGRPAVGHALVEHAAREGAGGRDTPWFAIGGIDPATVGEVVAAGATRIVVVRAIAEAADPVAATRALRAALPRPEADVGAA